MEYFGRFGTSTRTALFYIYGLSSAAVAVWYLLRPTLGLINVNRKFGIKEASVLIGNHFADVKDKLLNTLQLREEAGSKENSLLTASIDQRTAELSPIPFANAIPFKANMRYVKYALVPALLLLFVLIVSPGFKKSSQRVVNFDTHFEIEAPFEFVSNLDSLQAIQNQNINIQLDLTGDQIPTDAYVYIGEHRYKMKSDNVGSFDYTLSNIQKSEKVFFEAAGFSSKEYKIDISLKPSLVGYSATISYPKYLNLSSEKVRNLGEISIPEGSTIKWSFNTKNVENIVVLPEDKNLSATSNKTSFSKRFLKSSLIKVKTQNQEVANGDSVFYQINVIPDDYPEIAVEQKKDSLSNKIFYFIGDISDDHGLSKMMFHYRFTKSDLEENKDNSETIPINIDRSTSSQSFYHYWNLETLNIQAEDELEYYFTVWDNDGVNGAKASKTSLLKYRAPSLKEIEEQTEKANQEIKNSLAGAQSDASELEEEIKSI
ncbi:MAG: DUF4175 family protein, partial [Bacteroidia bacterium]